MTAEAFAVFLAVAAAAVFSPGPAMLAIHGLALRRGFAATMPAVLGNVVGAVMMMAAAVLGLAALLAAIPQGLTVLRWVGAAYLAWLGLQAIRMAGPGHEAGIGPGRGFLRGLLIALSNPKAILFFGAVLPQFVDPARPALPQFAVMTATFGGLELVVTAAVAAAAQGLAPLLRRPMVARAIGRIGGGIMLAAAVLVVALPVATP